MIGAIFSGLWVRLFAGLSALLLVGFLTQTIRIEGFWFVVGYKEEVAILRMDLSKIQVAQSIARAQAEAKAANDQAASRRSARRIDDDEDTALHDAAALYARAHRVRPKAAEGRPGPASPGRESDPAAGSDGPSGDAIVLTKSDTIFLDRSDYDTLIRNTSRLKRAQKWAMDCIEDGLCETAKGD